jgi:hypothetical protein
VPLYNAAFSVKDKEMSVNQNIRLQSYLAYMVIGGLPFYYFLREHIAISANVYAGLLGLLFLTSLYQNLISNFNSTSKTYKLLLLEIAIIIDLIFVFIYLGHLEKSLALMFVTLYISKSLFISISHYRFVTAANIIVCSSFIAGLGIIFGVAEHKLADTNWFTQKMGFDYPYSDGLGETTLINGFFASANGSAYSLGAGLAFIKFQNILQEVSRKALYIFFIIALFITKAKFAFLIATAYLGFVLLHRLPKYYLVIYLLILSVSYLFLSHIMIAAPGTYDYPSLHFRERLLSFGSIDFILGNYGAFKLYVLEAILLNNFMPIGLNTFVEIYSGRPHFMIGALIISGGIVTAILVIIYIYLILKYSWSEILTGLNRNQVYLTILFSFAVETINWNFTNSFYFWAIIMGLGSINKCKDF